MGWSNELEKKGSRIKNKSTNKQEILKENYIGMYTFR